MAERPWKRMVVLLNLGWALAASLALLFLICCPKAYGAVVENATETRHEILTVIRLVGDAEHRTLDSPKTIAILDGSQNGYFFTSIHNLGKIRSSQQEIGREKIARFSDPAGNDRLDPVWMLDKFLNTRITRREVIRSIRAGLVG